MVALLHHVTSISLFLVLKFLVGAPLLKVKSTFCWNRNSANSVAEIPGFVEDLSRFTHVLFCCPWSSASCLSQISSMRWTVFGAQGIHGCGCRAVGHENGWNLDKLVIGQKQVVSFFRWCWKEHQKSPNQEPAHQMAMTIVPCRWSNPLMHEPFQMKKLAISNPAVESKQLPMPLVEAVMDGFVWNRIADTWPRTTESQNGSNLTPQNRSHADGPRCDLHLETNGKCSLGAGWHYQRASNASRCWDGGTINIPFLLVLILIWCTFSIEPWADSSAVRSARPGTLDDTREIPGPLIKWFRMIQDISAYLFCSKGNLEHLVESACFGYQKWQLWGLRQKGSNEILQRCKWRPATWLHHAVVSALVLIAIADLREHRETSHHPIRVCRTQWLEKSLAGQILHLPLRSLANADRISY